LRSNPAWSDASTIRTSLTITPRGFLGASRAVAPSQGRETGSPVIIGGMRQRFKFLVAGVLGVLVVGGAFDRDAVRMVAQVAQPLVDISAEPTFRLNVDLVTTDVIVRGEDDIFISNLTEDDFEVYEDGVPQEIASLVLVQGGRVFNVLEPPAPAPQEGVLLPATRSAKAISAAEGLRLLEPWIGSGDIAIDLPLPRLIDLQVDPDSASDADSIRAALEGEVPGVRVDDHGRWVGRLLALIRSIEAVAMAVVLLIGAASILAVVFVTQTGLAVHNDVIEVLHLVGARDRYIAGQFQRHALNQAARGTLAGTVLALVTILGLTLIGAPADLPLLPTMRLGLNGWLALAAVPLAALAIAALTARMTVLRALHRMP